jgi:hypothetical protein
MEPVIDIIAHKLRDDLEASRVEAALIDLMGLDNLTNAVRGRYSVDYPRRLLTDLIIEHAAQRVEVVDPALLIRINRQFRYGMSPTALSECTRGIWVIGNRRNRARLAMAVYDGVVREVFEVDSWHRAGSTPYETRDQAALAKLRDKRWEFIGRVAEELYRSRYVGGAVGHLFKPGQQSPIVGVNIG